MNPLGSFEFATAHRIVFGAGMAAKMLPQIALEFGSRALLVVGREERGLVPGLAAAGLDSLSVFRTPGEPTVDLVRAGALRARAEDRDVVIAIGGGSAIDCGKAVAALAANSGEPLDYLEVIGQGRPLEHDPLPFIAVPTTAGTGSEVTRNAVLGSPAHGVKASLRSARMLPRAAVVDPELTLDLPPDVTAATGLDALTQLIEPFVSARANALVDALCRDAIPRAFRALPRAFRDGADREARAEMSFAALLGGLALANSGLGVVHGFAAPIGGGFDAPHGAVCAALLAPGMLANIAALRARAPGHPALERYRELAQMLTGDAGARAEDGVEPVARLCAELRIPPLRTYGIGPEHIPELVEKAARASSMKANPIALTNSELACVLDSAR